MSDQQEPDSDLISSLDNLRPQAQAILEHGDKQARLGIWLGQPPHRWQELLESVMPVLSAHPEFGHGTNYAFGPKQTMLHPSFLSTRAVQYAANHGGAAAVAWLRRLFNF